MMTVITETTISADRQSQWDQAFHERLADAREQQGWIAVQLLVPIDAPNKRVVIGTWESQEAWEAWHRTETFQRTRQAMDAVSEGGGEERWFRVVEHAQGDR